MKRVLVMSIITLGVLNLIVSFWGAMRAQNQLSISCEWLPVDIEENDH